MIGSSVSKDANLNIVVDSGHAYAIVHFNNMRYFSKHRSFAKPLDCKNECYK